MLNKNTPSQTSHNHPQKEFLEWYIEQVTLLGNMFKRGRAEGWLRRPIDALPLWAEFHGVRFNGIKVGSIPGLEDRGSTVIADRDLAGGKEDPLMVVPKDLIISRQNIEIIAKADHHLKEVLDAVGDFGRVSYQLCQQPVPVLIVADYSGCCVDLPCLASNYSLSGHQRHRSSSSSD